uniref:Uncharacterized protein n=1 Tax=Rangifer tarandus platyrhynchus TaxID=3082113 RepID=A0ACB0DX79_RANTA|nr:unnamed protein product [Rangifer tarandus platyrhynchus]
MEHQAPVPVRWPSSWFLVLQSWPPRRSHPRSCEAREDVFRAQVFRGLGLPALGRQKLYGPIGVSSPGLRWPYCWRPVLLVANLLQTQRFEGTLKLLVMRKHPPPQEPQQGLLLLGATSGTGTVGPRASGSVVPRLSCSDPLGSLCRNPGPAGKRDASHRAARARHQDRRRNWDEALFVDFSSSAMASGQKAALATHSNTGHGLCKHLLPGPAQTSALTRRGFPRNPLCPHPLPELPVGVTRAASSMTLPRPPPGAPPHCTLGPAGGGRRVALQTQACPDRTCRAPVPGPRALAELHLPWARPPWAAYLALGCRPQPAHILLCPRRPDCTARISYLTADRSECRS